MTIISIIEDNTNLRNSWEMFLNESDGISEVFGFETVKEAVQSRHLRETEILLLDIQLPEMNGIDGIPLILKENPETKIPIISVFDEGNFLANPGAGQPVINCSCVMKEFFGS